MKEKGEGTLTPATTDGPAKEEEEGTLISMTTDSSTKEEEEGTFLPEMADVTAEATDSGTADRALVNRACSGNGSDIVKHDEGSA